MHLAQLNVGRLRAPLDDPAIDDFRDNLAAGERPGRGEPGFVWRLQDEGGDATGIKLFDDDLEIINLTVWESIDALADFTYRSGHVEFLRRRREFFEAPSQPIMCLWWIPEGTIPPRRRRWPASSTCAPTAPPPSRSRSVTASSRATAAARAATTATPAPPDPAPADAARHLGGRAGRDGSARRVRPRQGGALGGQRPTSSRPRGRQPLARWRSRGGRRGGRRVDRAGRRRRPPGPCAGRAAWSPPFLR